MKSIKTLFLTISLMLTANYTQADLIVIMSASSTVGNLNKNQVSAIFLGKTDTFPDGSQAVPIEQVEGTTQHEEFHNLVTEKSDAQLKSYWSKMVFSGKGNPPKEVPNSAEVLKLIAANPNMIGYLDNSLINNKLKIVFKP